MRFLRSSEIILGLVFLAGACGKALDMDSFAIQIRHYGLDMDIATLRLPAYGTTVIEAFLGAALVAGIRLRGTVAAITAVMLVGFSALIAYGWAFHGLKDCGCFGKFMPMTPGVSILKNVVLFAMSIAAFILARGKHASEPDAGSRRGFQPMQIAVAIACLAAVGGSGIYGKATAAPVKVPGIAAASQVEVNAAPFAKFTLEYYGQQIDLGKGLYLVALLSSTCEHCKGEVPALNELLNNPELPVVALMDGTDQEYADFQAETFPEFPSRLIDRLDFYNILDAAVPPPMFFLIRDGRIEKKWKETTPTPDELAQVTAASAGSS